MSGHDAPEWPVTLGRNGWSRWTGIPTEELTQRISLDKTRLQSATFTFLFLCATPEEAREKQMELRRHAEAVLNHVSRPLRSKGKPSQTPCYSVGSEHGYTLYIKRREFKISAYIKQPNVSGAFANFSSVEIAQEVTEIAQRTVRVEVEIFELWLREEELENPATWSRNPAAYEKVFQLAVDTLRLVEGLRVRRPTEDVIAKLPAEHQTILNDHLDGADIRGHELVLSCSGTVEQLMTAQNKRFSAFKRSILDVTGVDISIPWLVQTEGMSATLKNWFKFPGEFQPSDHLKEHIYSRDSARAAIAGLRDAAESGNSLVRMVRRVRVPLDEAEDIQDK